MAYENITNKIDSNLTTDGIGERMTTNSYDTYLGIYDEIKGIKMAFSEFDDSTRIDYLKIGTKKYNLYGKNVAELNEMVSTIVNHISNIEKRLEDLEIAVSYISYIG